VNTGITERPSGPATVMIESSALLSTRLLIPLVARLAQGVDDDRLSDLAARMAGERVREGRRSGSVVTGERRRLERPSRPGRAGRVGVRGGAAHHSPATSSACASVNAPA
jgi:hypothetical protein